MNKITKQIKIPKENARNTLKKKKLFFFKKKKTLFRKHLCEINSCEENLNARSTQKVHLATRAHCKAASIAWR